MKHVLVFIIRFYQRFISPITVLVFGHACRYSPTCSEYSIQSIKRYGVIKGISLSIRRLLSCNPFSKKAYFDPAV